MTSAPAAEEVYARLQAVQDELAQKYNVAIVIRDRHGQPLTTPSKSVEQKASLSASALQGLYHCLSSNWLLRDQDALQGKRLVATLFSGGVAVAALPMIVDSDVAAVVLVAQTFGEVRRKLELLNEQVVSSGGAISREDFLDPVDIYLGAHFVAMLEAIEQAVGEVLGLAPVASAPEAHGVLPPVPVTERLLGIIPAGVFVTTVDWQISAANQELARMLGYADGQELVGRNLLGDLMDLEFLPLLEELQGRDEIVARQVRLRAADGDQLPAVLSMAAIESEAGTPPRYLGVVQRAEKGVELLRAPAMAPAQLEALVEGWPTPALLVDSSQRILRHSRAVEQELGYAAGELAGAQLQSVIAGAEGVFEVAETSPSPAPRVLGVHLLHKSGDWTGWVCVAVPAAGAVALLALPARSTPGFRPEAGHLLRSLVAPFPLASLVCTGDGKILHANVALATLTGYTEEELRGRSLSELVPSGKQANLAGWLSEARAGQLVDTTLTVCRKDGALAEVGARMFAVHEENGTPFVVVTLQEAERRSDADGDQCYRQLVEASRDLYWAIEIPDPEHFELGIPLQLSRGFADIPDLATLKAEGGLLRAKITHTPESWETFRRSCLAVLRTGRVMSGVRTVHVDREGRVVQTFVTEILPLYREGKLVGVHGLARDTTQEYLLQQELRRSEEKYRTLVEHAAVGVCLVDRQGAVIQVNRAGLEILGASPDDDLSGRAMATLVDEQTREALARELARGPLRAREVTATRLDGRKVELLVHAREVTTPGHGQCVEAWFTDVTRRRTAERRLRESEERFRSFAESIAEGVVIANTAGGIVYANRRVAELFGYTRKELAGMELWEFFHPSERESLRSFFVQLMQGQATRVQTEGDGLTKAAAILRLEVSLTPRRKKGKVVGAFVVLRDLTQQRSLEEQLQQAQKMESVGMLAGGIAHDFNNILTEILGYASLIDAEEELPEHLRGMVNQIIELASLAGSLTQQLIAFSRNTRPQRRPMQLNEVVRETARFLSHSMPEGIALSTHLAKDLRIISGDPVQLQQVLINLCVNARDAMPEGGKIVIKTENLTLTEEQRRQFKNQQLHEVVRLRVSDTGVGMDQETMKHIFEPFFTTKSKGKGSGLGLSIVYVIVAGHGGEIKVTSAPGQGATFDIYLPALTEQLKPEPEKRRLPLKGGDECVLLVDDQEQMLELAQRMLSRHGYKVLTAKGGVEGVELFRQRADEIDLVILDLLMPDLAGEECARIMRSERPDVAILLTSGFVPAPRGQEELAQVSDGILQKPFGLRQLLTVVRATLDAKKQHH